MKDSIGKKKTYDQRVRLLRLALVLPVRSLETSVRARRQALRSRVLAVGAFRIAGGSGVDMVRARLEFVGLDLREQTVQQKKGEKGDGVGGWDK